MQSFKLFETEMSKILYIRDHYKNTIYDVIKDKANLKNPQHYVFANDMIQDLEQMFGGFDKEGKADAELQNPKFAMRAKNAKETFDAFHTRFIATIAPLDMSEREKTDHLKRLIANRLKYRILDYPSSTSYRELALEAEQLEKLKELKELDPPAREQDVMRIMEDATPMAPLPAEVDATDIPNMSQIDSERKINVSSAYNLDTYQMKPTLHAERNLG
ncbi:MAG: hypothetical protein ASARMPREDX12_002976 [Alectoria sarmentosa]|nr:MAG: hypothetical protein ASARMPREDX12_002976 [Alectoria sarmentosa]